LLRRFRDAPRPRAARVRVARTLIEKQRFVNWLGGVERGEREDSCDRRSTPESWSSFRPRNLYHAGPLGLDFAFLIFGCGAKVTVVKEQLIRVSNLFASGPSFADKGSEFREDCTSLGRARNARRCNVSTVTRSLRKSSLSSRPSPWRRRRAARVRIRSRSARPFSIPSAPPRLSDPARHHRRQAGALTHIGGLTHE
jgi:hypothetical protein